MTPTRLRRLLNVWPPYVGAGVRVLEIADDWSYARVRHRVRRLTANLFGTAFGGTLSAMSDPFYTLLATHQLGPGYHVWDAAGQIEFAAPGRGSIYGTYEMSPAVVEEIRAETVDGNKHLRWFETELTSGDGTIVARVRRQLYVRRKQNPA